MCSVSNTIHEFSSTSVTFLGGGGGGETHPAGLYADKPLHVVGFNCLLLHCVAAMVALKEHASAVATLGGRRIHVHV